MTMRWKKGRNPYLHNPFGVLQLGPFAKPNEIVPQEKKLRNKLKRGKEGLSVAGVQLEEHDLGEASKALRDPGGLAEALLLTHPQSRVNDRRRKTLSSDIKAFAAAEALPPTLKFTFQGGLCWFAPSPLSVLSGPAWQDIAADIAAGSEGDRLLDIEFDV